MKSEERAKKAMALAYKRPALSSMGYEAMMEELEEIQAACDDVQYWIDSDDGTLLDAFDGDTEQEWEFRMAFGELSASCYQLSDSIYDSVESVESFDDCTVALIGNRYEVIGFDSFQEDYTSLTQYEQELAETEAGKRLMRLTKKEMIAQIGMSFGILLAFFDLRHKYDYLKSAMDVLRDENHSLIQLLKDIDGAYLAAASAEYEYQARPLWEKFQIMTRDLPERIWVEA